MWWTLMFACGHRLALEAELTRTRAELATVRAELERRQAEVAGLAGDVEACAGGAAEADLRSLLALARSQRATGDIPGAIAAFQEVETKDPKGTDGMSARRALSELKIVGRPAPVVGVHQWIQGSQPAPGTIQVVLFFEAWCPHCQLSTPEMQQVQERWADRGLTVVGYTSLSKGGTVEDTRQFLDRVKAYFPVAVEDGSGTDAYVVTGIPAVAVVKDGVVVYRGHPAEINDALLTTLSSR